MGKGHYKGRHGPKPEKSDFLLCQKKRVCPVGANPFAIDGAEEGTRTPTGLRPLDPEPSASTSSATSAKDREVVWHTSWHFSHGILIIYR